VRGLLVASQWKSALALALWSQGQYAHAFASNPSEASNSLVLETLIVSVWMTRFLLCHLCYPWCLSGQMKNAWLRLVRCWLQQLHQKRDQVTSLYYCGNSTLNFCVTKAPAREPFLSFQLLGGKLLFRCLPLPKGQAATLGNVVFAWQY